MYFTKKSRGNIKSWWTDQWDVPFKYQICALFKKCARQKYTIEISVKPPQRNDGHEEEEERKENTVTSRANSVVPCFTIGKSQRSLWSPKKRCIKK